MDIITVVHLVNRLGAQTAVDDVSVTVAAGDGFGFPGPTAPTSDDA